MDIKKLQNSYTTPEQSKILLELGIPVDSADFIYTRYGIKIMPNGARYSKYNWIVADGYETYPIWSVGRLIEILLLCHIYDEAGIMFDKPLYEVSNCTNIEWCIRVLESSIQCKHIDFSKLEK